MIKYQKKINSIIFIIGALYLNYCLMMVFEAKFFEYLSFVIRGILFYKMFFYVINLRKQFLWIYFLLIIYYLIYGLLKSNFLSFLIMDLLSSFSIIFLFIINPENRLYITERLTKMICLLLIISALCSLLYLNKYGFRAAEQIGERIVFEEEGSNFKIIFQTLQISIILLPFIWFFDNKRKLILVFAFSLFTIINLVALSRAYIVAAIISIIFTLFEGFRLKKIRLRYSVLSIIFVITISLFFIINKNKELLTISYDLLKYRFELIDDEEEPRDIEAEYYFKDLSNYELILGKGMGAANLRPFGKYSERGIMMMHRGENNLIMKGGIVLLIIFYGLAFYSMLKLFLSNDIYGNIWASVIFIYLILERGHQQFSSVFMLILICIAISYAFSLKKNNNG
mgnify:CR=1 FL=1